MNLFAKASRRLPLARPLKDDSPNEFQQRQHAFKRRCRMGRYLHQSTGLMDEHTKQVRGETYVKPKEEK